MHIANRVLVPGVCLVLLSSCGRQTPRPQFAAAKAEVREERQREFQAKVQLGREAVEAQRFEEALTVLGEATKLVPVDKVAKELYEHARIGARKADFERSLAAGREAMAIKEFEKAHDFLKKANAFEPDNDEVKTLLGQAEFAWRLEQGERAMDAKQFEDAVKAYSAATQLRPDDAEGKDRLEKAHEARRIQVKMEFGAAMSAGRTGMANKDYAAASKSFDQALRLIADDTEAASLGEEARFQLNLEEGQKALTANRLNDAIQFSAKAAQLRPTNVQAQELQKRTQAAKQKRDKMDFDEAMRSGKEARVAGRLADAIRDFEKAQRVAPGDAEATRLLGEAKTKKTKQDYDGHVNRGRAAQASQRYDEALRAFQDADALMPGGEASRLRTEVTRQIADAQARKKKQDYDSHLSRGRAAQASQRYDEALRAFQDADALFPGGEASRLRAEVTKQVAEVARQAAEAQAKKIKQEFDNHINRGRTALTSQRFDDAIRAFQDAERLIPNGEAQTLRLDAQSRKQTEYTNRVNQARTALFSKRYDEAIRLCLEAEKISFGGEAMSLRMDAQSKKKLGR